MTVARGASLTLIAICAVAFVLRVIGLQYGLPAVYNPDEVAIMARALSFAKGSLNPENFLYPTFYFYVLFAWVGAYLAFIWVTGGVASIGALQQLYFTDAVGIYTAGRLLGALAGTATVPLVYTLAARLTGTRTALAAALILAVAPLHVRDSHYVKHDVPATLAIVVAYLAMTRVWPSPAADGPRRRDVLIAGAACGVAFSTHYYTVFLALPLMFVIVQGWKTQGLAACVRELIVAGIASAVVFFALSPFLLVEPATAFRDITANRHIVVDRAVSAGAFAPAWRYLEMLGQEAVGLPLAVLASIGVIWMLAAAPSRAIFLLAFAVPFLAFIVNTAPASRYLNPVLPFLVIFSAGGIWKLVEGFRNADVTFWIAVVGFAVRPMAASIESDLFFRKDDTRTLAKRYIEATIPPGTTILIQPYSAPLTPSREGLAEALTKNVGSVDAASIKFRLQLSIDPYPSPSYRLLYLGRGGMDAEKLYVDPGELGGANGLEPLRRLNVAYLVLTRYNRPDPVTLPFLTALAREARRIAAFTPYRAGAAEGEQARIDPFLHNTDARIDDALERPGPTLEIWQLDDSGPKR